MSHSEELLNRVRNITSSTLRQIENSNNVEHDNLDFCIRQFDQIVWHLQHIVNVDSTIADELPAILHSIETIRKTLENSVNGNRLSIQVTPLEYSGTGRPKLNVSTTIFISSSKMDSNAQLLQKCFKLLSELSDVTCQNMALPKKCSKVPLHS